MTIFSIIAGLLTIVSLAYLLLKDHQIKKFQAVALIIIAPITLVLVYQQIGNVNALTANTSNTNSNQENVTNQLDQLDPQQIQFAISKLIENIQNDPNDINSLNLLSNSYLLLERYNDATETLEKLIALGQSDSETLMKTINSYNFVDQGQINDRAYELIQQLLKQSPNHPQGLWVAGMSEIQRGRVSNAKDYWNTLMPILAGTPQQEELKNIIAQLDNDISQDVNSNDTDSSSADMQSLTININVKLADQFDKNRAKDDDVVFVFARAKEGPPAPLAVKRFTVAELPLTIELTNQDAMISELNISGYQQIVLSAKISKTGDPFQKQGDINSELLLIDMQQQESLYLLEIK